ncbi:MAG TPA: hypothetical protein H9673_00680 [Candidatus Adamsella sp.]|nr:hypothetical protein [Candidatus Adamsella sp.]
MKIEIEKPRIKMAVEFYVLMALLVLFIAGYIFACSFFYKELQAESIFDFISKIKADDYNNLYNEYRDTVRYWKMTTGFFAFCLIFPVWSMVYYFINLYNKLNLKYFIADHNSVKLVCKKAGKTEVLQFLYDEIENFIVELYYTKSMERINGRVVSGSDVFRFDYIGIGIDVKSNIDSKRLMLKQKIVETASFWNSMDSLGLGNESDRCLFKLRKDVNDIYKFINLKNKVKKLSIIYGAFVPENVKEQIEQYEKSLDVSDNTFDKPQLSAGKQPVKSHIQIDRKKYMQKAKIPNVIGRNTGDMVKSIVIPFILSIVFMFLVFITFLLKKYYNIEVDLSKLFM